MLIYQLLSIDDLRALLLSILVGESVKERLARDKESSISIITDQHLLPVFFCLWARSLVF